MWMLKGGIMALTAREAMKILGEADKDGELDKFRRTGAHRLILREGKRGPFVEVHVDDPKARLPDPRLSMRIDGVDVNVLVRYRRGSPFRKRIPHAGRTKKGACAGIRTEQQNSQGTANGGGGTAGWNF